MRKISVASVLVLAMAAGPSEAIDKGKAMYVGGTLVGVAEKTEGPIYLKGAEKLAFMPKGSVVEVPWSRVEDVEYGQKAGRRIKTAILISPLALFGKSRKHYVTLAFKDEKDSEQVAVFEFDKDDIRMALAVIKARTGKEITFQDEEAKKQMGGGSAKE
ncbi:MAG: hypothetical protein JJE39_10220 [Vicinamibacteria bacterium]|nr:hypothetical protein [Vicinamibacteria bacterium]